MSEMTLPSRHRIRNSNPGGLRPSTLPLGHGGSPQILSFTSGWGRNLFFLSNHRDRETSPELVKGSDANNYPMAPGIYGTATMEHIFCHDLYFVQT